MIKRYLMLLVILLGLSSCESTPRPSFKTMSETELVTYNASLSMDDQIICREEIEGWRIFSGAISFREEIEGSWKFFSERTQPKVCFSIQQLKRAQRNAEMGFGGFIGGAGYGTFSDGGYQPADAADYPSTFQN